MMLLFEQLTTNALRHFPNTPYKNFQFIETLRESHLTFWKIAFPIVIPGSPWNPYRQIKYEKLYAAPKPSSQITATCQWKKKSHVPNPGTCVSHGILPSCRHTRANILIASLCSTRGTLALACIKAGGGYAFSVTRSVIDIVPAPSFLYRQGEFFAPSFCTMGPPDGDLIANGIFRRRRGRAVSSLGVWRIFKRLLIMDVRNNFSFSAELLRVLGCSLCLQICAVIRASDSFMHARYNCVCLGWSGAFSGWLIN